MRYVRTRSKSASLLLQKEEHGPKPWLGTRLEGRMAIVNVEQVKSTSLCSPALPSKNSELRLEHYKPSSRARRHSLRCFFYKLKRLVITIDAKHSFPTLSNAKSLLFVIRYIPKVIQGWSSSAHVPSHSRNLARGLNQNPTRRVRVAARWRWL